MPTVTSWVSLEMESQQSNSDVGRKEYRQKVKNTERQKRTRKREYMWRKLIQSLFADEVTKHLISH